jgi:protein phosphatase 1G
MGAYMSQPITEKETAAGAADHFRFGIASHQGWRKTQEDAHLAEQLTDEHHIFGVFDGHGGPEVARFCAKLLPRELKSHAAFQQGDHESSLVAVFHRMDELLTADEGRAHLEALRPRGDDDGLGAQEEALAILRKYMSLQEGNGNGNGAGSLNPPTTSEDDIQAGTTAVVALLSKETVYVANAGDSRAVLSRANQAVPLSQDHKPAAVTERERIIAAGGFVSEIGGICRVNGNLSLSRAIGDLRYKQNRDLHPSQQIVTATPDVHRVELTPEDQFIVLACDGIWDVMSNQQVVDFVNAGLAQGREPTAIAIELLDACVASDPRETRGIGCDNMTCCIIVLGTPPDTAATAPAPPSE